MAEYGLSSSLRQKARQQNQWFDLDSGKITGFDYNLFYSFDFSAVELLAILKHSLDLRLAGNRSPMILGAHSDYYHGRKSPDAAMRRQVLSDFIDYALSKPEVRVVRYEQLLDWPEQPVPLDTQSGPFYPLQLQIIEHQHSSEQCTQADWQAGQEYPGGSEVAYLGQAWRSQWWSQNEAPGASQWGPWQAMGSCQSIEYLTHGQTLPTGPLMLAAGSWQAISLLPDPGYQLDYVLFNGQALEVTEQPLMLQINQASDLVVRFRPLD